MSANLRQEMAQPRGSSRWLRLEGVLDSAVGEQAVLDHQELVGEAMGRAWLLPVVQRAWDVWDEHNGFCCDDTDLLVILYAENCCLIN